MSPAQNRLEARFWGNFRRTDAELLSQLGVFLSGTAVLGKDHFRRTHHNAGSWMDLPNGSLSKGVLNPMIGRLKRVLGDDRPGNDSTNWETILR